MHSLGYCNNITGESQPCRPIQFRGGILADEMGLGKSYSMIALIASDIGNHIKLTDSESAVQGTTNISATLLIVPPSRKYAYPMLKIYTYNRQSCILGKMNLLCEL
jgi:hypothetical protein